MKMVTGSSVSDEALSTRNRICALLAVIGRWIQRLQLAHRAQADRRGRVVQAQARWRRSSA
jgi:hypothetical protein